ncbi:tetratricopeptide repeat protein [Actinoplanes sp. NEAU-A12]|uniref:Tetratricopeptide repeat protein n=1 Tax=Actinoplanes sandaracinus TaxID=3045177 RepID=A0ABT6WVI3_9ACTN|nr:tetratricopeptide repeat protein [Actinoplanes sandaracinus]MDI6103757.1 tetratricopeptide repeat protein [Actinoplanes sandaracinus]
MSGQRPARAAAVAFTVLVLTAIGLGGTRLGWWDTPQKAEEAAGGTFAWLEPVSWIAGALSLLVTIYYARWQHAPAGTAPAPAPTVMPAQQLTVILQSPYAAATALARSSDGLVTMSVHSPPPGDADPPDRGRRDGGGQGPVNQDVARKSLKEHLTAGRSCVIAVHGRPGVGKSMLVESVTREIGTVPKWIRLFSDHRLDVMALVRAVGPAGQPALRDHEDVLDRLQAALDEGDGPPVTVVVDGAHHLLEPGTATLKDLRLEEALRKVASGRPRPVKVVLIGDRAPELGRGNQPADDPVRIFVHRLSATDFRTCLERIAADQSVDLGAVDWGRLHQVLQGVPRLGQLFCSALALSRDRITADGLLRRLVEEFSGDRERALATIVVQSLHDEQRRVAAALAAYRTPVSLDLVNELLDEELPAMVGPRLNELVDAHLVGRSDDKYHVLNAQVLAALDARPDGPDSLLHQAAEVLSRRNGPTVRAGSAFDLDLRFAEIDLWCRAGRWLTAFERVERLDRVLRPIGAAELLLKPREAVAPHLESAADRTANHNTIGTIYLARGDLEKARAAFEEALDEVPGSGQPVHHERKIRLNLADLAWRDGDFAGAQGCFQQALDMVRTGEDQDVEDRRDRIAALAGLADCARHWGDHQAAIRLGTSAWEAAAAEGTRQGVRIAVRLARWHSECGDPDEAAEFMSRADTALQRYAADDAALRAQCLDGRADLALDTGDYAGAARLAAAAVAMALRVHAPNTVLQARTTLAMAHLRLAGESVTERVAAAELVAARKAVEEALPYRRDSRSLAVLALRALITFRQNPDGPADLYFADLLAAAVARRREKRDYAAWEFEGLARAADHALRHGRLKPAVFAFEKARALCPAPVVLRDRLEYQLRLLAVRMPAESMEILVDAATGRAEQSRRP